MPLTRLPLRGTVEDDNGDEFHDSLQVQPQKEPGSRCGTEVGQDSGYEDFDEQDDDECIDSDMEGSVMDRPRPKKANKIPPPLPQRNERRASRILDNVLLELKSLDGSTSKELEQRSILTEEDPHESYLSSEEDASLSDDYEDSDLDLELPDSNESDDQGSSRPSTSKSQEDTARVVSFVVGKPQIVDIFYYSPTSPHQRHSVALDQLTSLKDKNIPELRRTKPMHRPSPLNLFPTTSRRVSVSSVSSNTTTSTTNTHSNPAAQPAPTHSTSYIAPLKTASKSTTNLHSSSKSISNLPPRKSSRITSNLHSLKTTLAQSLNHNSPTASSSALPQSSIKHSFLNMDPFEAAHVRSPSTPSPTTPRHSFHQQTPTTPKTPTGTSSASWQLTHGLSRTLSKARKPSMPKLNQAYTNSANAVPTSQTSLARNESTTSLTQQPHVQAEREDNEEPHDRTFARRSMTMSSLIAQQFQQANEESSSKLTKSFTPSIKESRKGTLGAMMGLGRKRSGKTPAIKA